MKLIPLLSEKYNGLYAIVDDDCYLTLSKLNWRAFKSNNTFYAVRDIRRDGKKAIEFMHHLIVQRKDGYQVDHKDRDGLNNVRENLRPCSHSENMRNRRCKSDSSTGLKGVTPFNGRYQARISVHGKRHFLGYYNSAQEAHEAYISASVRLHGEFRRAS